MTEETDKNDETFYELQVIHLLDREIIFYEYAVGSKQLTAGFRDLWSRYDHRAFMIVAIEMYTIYDDDIDSLFLR